MDKVKAKKQLGINPGTASNRLRKAVLFQFVQLAREDTCYQCGKTIESIDEFSIEHMEPWLDSDNPKEKFFNLDNIAFSHLRCNIAAKRSPNKIEWPEGQAWCSGCKQMHPLSKFPDSKPIKRGKVCRKCSARLWHEKSYYERRKILRNKYKVK